MRFFKVKVDSAEYEGEPVWDRTLASNSKNALAIPLSLFMFVSLATRPLDWYSAKGTILKSD